MKYDVRIPQWIDGCPLFIRGIEAVNQEDAVNIAIDKLKPLYDRYGQETPKALYDVATSKLAPSTGEDKRR